MAKNSINIPKSRYIQGGTVDIKPNRLDWWERKTIEKSNDDVVVAIISRYHHRPDLVAFDYYNDPSLMWLVLQYNNILDINEEFVKGKVITIPSPIRAQLSIAAAPVGSGNRSK